MYVYCADTYCDSCGEDIAAKIRESGETVALPDDSDHFPQYEYESGETDGPDHCASADTCLEAIDLGDYGLPVDATLYGAEGRKVGAILSETLTGYGAGYLAEMLTETPRTPYQVALHNLWRETFADYIEDDSDED